VRGQQPAEAVPGWLGSGDRIKQRKGARFTRNRPRGSPKLPTGTTYRITARATVRKPVPQTAGSALAKKAMTDTLLEPRIREHHVGLSHPEAIARAGQQIQAASKQPGSCLLIWPDKSQRGWQMLIASRKPAWRPGHGTSVPRAVRQAEFVPESLREPCGSQGAIPMGNRHPRPPAIQHSVCHLSRKRTDTECV
jgi:hypothetical protein